MLCTCFELFIICRKIIKKKVEERTEAEKISFNFMEVLIIYNVFSSFIRFNDNALKGDITRTFPKFPCGRRSLGSQYYCCIGTGTEDGQMKVCGNNCDMSEVTREPFSRLNRDMTLSPPQRFYFCF